MTVFLLLSFQREGFSCYNKIYEFEYQLFNQHCNMVMTSVSGHLLNFDFVGQYKKWYLFMNKSSMAITFLTRLKKRYTVFKSVHPVSYQTLHCTFAYIRMWHLLKKMFVVKCFRYYDIKSWWQYVTDLAYVYTLSSWLLKEKYTAFIEMLLFSRHGCSPVALFDAQVEKFCPENFTDIKVWIVASKFGGVLIV